MGLISSCRLGDVFDFVGVHCEPLPTVCLWPAGPCVLVRFISLTDLVQSFPYLTVAVLTGIASIHRVASSHRWTKDQLVDEPIITVWFLALCSFSSSIGAVEGSVLDGSSHVLQTQYCIVLDWRQMTMGNPLFS